MFTSTPRWRANRRRRRHITNEWVCPACACELMWQTPKTLCRKCARYEWSSNGNVQRPAAYNYIIIVVVVVFAFVDTAPIVPAVAVVVVVVAVTFRRVATAVFVLSLPRLWYPSSISSRRHRGDKTRDPAAGTLQEWKSNMPTTTTTVSDRYQSIITSMPIL